MMPLFSASLALLPGAPYLTHEPSHPRASVSLSQPKSQPGESAQSRLLDFVAASADRVGEFARGAQLAEIIDPIAERNRESKQLRNSWDSKLSSSLQDRQKAAEAAAEAEERARRRTRAYKQLPHQERWLARLDDPNWASSPEVTTSNPQPAARRTKPSTDREAPVEWAPKLATGVATAAVVTAAAVMQAAEMAALAVTRNEEEEVVMGSGEPLSEHAAVGTASPTAGVEEEAGRLEWERRFAAEWQQQQQQQMQQMEQQQWQQQQWQQQPQQQPPQQQPQQQQDSGAESTMPRGAAGGGSPPASRSAAQPLSHQEMWQSRLDDPGWRSNAMAAPRGGARDAAWAAEEGSRAETKLTASRSSAAAEPRAGGAARWAPALDTAATLAAATVMQVAEMTAVAVIKVAGDQGKHAQRQQEAGDADDGDELRQ